MRMVLVGWLKRGGVRRSGDSWNLNGMFRGHGAAQRL